MCKAMEDMRREAMERGIEQGETRFGNLAAELFSLGRAKDVERAALDPQYRAQLFKESRLGRYQSPHLIRE